MMTQEKDIRIPVAHGFLQAMIQNTPNASAIAIMCHPHSLHGGSMSNKVVTTITKVWQSVNYHTIRFNFRSVGESTGAFDEGRGEQEDLAAVIAFAKEKWGDLPIVLGGFSFGAFVALSFCQHFIPQALWLIAPPAQYDGFAQLKTPQAAQNFLMVAENDEVVSTPDILHWANTQSFQSIITIPEASHFFHGKLLLLRDAIEQQSQMSSAHV